MPKPIIYTDKGTGPVVVLLHGFCESKDIWISFAKQLATSHRVICPDLPGFGESILDRDDISMEWFAEQLHALMMQLNIRSFTFIGHSLGGYVGLAYAATYMQHLTGLCLFHSTAYADSGERKENRNKTIAFIEKYGADMFTQSFIEPLFLLKNRDRLKNDIAELKRIAKQSSQKGIIATTKAMRDRTDRTQVLALATFPILLIGGKNDATIPISSLQKLAQLSPLIDLACIDECGHMGMFEQKEKTFEVLKEFLEKIVPVKK
jgi:pimeloyl-ACP methyl ester carboxylesterase